MIREIVTGVDDATYGYRLDVRCFEEHRGHLTDGPKDLAAAVSAIASLRERCKPKSVAVVAHFSLVHAVGSKEWRSAIAAFPGVRWTHEWPRVPVLFRINYTLDRTDLLRAGGRPPARNWASGYAAGAARARDARGRFE